MKLIEAQIQPHDDSLIDEKSQLKNYRAELLADYKRRVKDEDGDEYPDYALYTAKQHSMHKGEFFKWRKGTHPVANPQTETFERFLRGNTRPIPRPAPAPRKNSKP
jgi:hypothetical protein